MKNLILGVIFGITFLSCKKDGEEIIPKNEKLNICQNCVTNYLVEITSNDFDTVFSSKIDTIKFTYCGETEYQNHIGGSYKPIYEFDSLGNTIQRRILAKLLLSWHCEYKEGYEIIIPKNN